MADPNYATDMVAFEQWFNQKHPLSQDIEQAKKELPMFKGEPKDAKAKLIRRGFVVDKMEIWLSHKEVQHHD